MEFSVPQLVTYIATWFGLSGGIWALFERAETVIKDDFRKKISSWLKNDFNEKIDLDLPGIFIKTFDHVFGEKHFSFRCFFRSCVASIVAVLIMTLIITSVSNEIWNNYGCIRPSQRLKSGKE